MYGDDGFSASWFSRKAGASFRLAVDRATFTAADCPDQPVPGTDGPSTTCVRDGDAWYRTTDGHSEYALPEKGLVVRVSGDGVPRADLPPEGDGAPDNHVGTGG
ncbi:hypothetical protein [Streptomyces sp. YKOK-I1]